MKTLYSFLTVIFFSFSSTQTVAQPIPKWKAGDVKSFIEQSDKPTVINFFATWCKPCVEELPHFIALQKKWDSAGVRLIFVSLDMKQAYPVKLKSFVAKHRINTPVFFLDETDADVFCPAVDKSWSGAIPATLFINNKTGYRKFYEEQLPKEKIEEEIQKAMVVK